MKEADVPVVYFSNQAVQSSVDGLLIDHTRSRGVEVVTAETVDDYENRFDEVNGVIVHLNAEDGVVRRDIELAKKLGRPILGLAPKTAVYSVELPTSKGMLSPVRYTNLVIAGVAIDVYLEATLGYRVPLTGHKSHKSESSD